MTKDGFRRFKGHEEFIAWLRESGYEQCRSLGCGVVLSRDDIYAIVVRDPCPDEDGYVSFTDWMMDEEALASCDSVMEVQEMFEGYAWSCIDNLVLDEEGNLFHLKMTLLEQGRPGRSEPEGLAETVMERMKKEKSDPEFNRQESIVIESFLDLYCHDCPDKTQCDNCRLNDVWDYLHDMGDLSE